MAPVVMTVVTKGMINTEKAKEKEKKEMTKAAITKRPVYS